jgi:PAS domain S-box-containing protein
LLLQSAPVEVLTGITSGGNAVHQTESTSRYWLYIAQVVILAGIYFGTTKLGLSMASTKGMGTLTWPPTGIALAALLLFGYHLWPGVALGAFLAHVSASALWVAVGISAGNTLEAITGAYLLQRGIGFRNGLERRRDVLGLVGLAAVIGPFCSATIGVASLGLNGVIPRTTYISTWWVWWLGDAIGVLLVAPVLLTWGANFHINRRLSRLIEVAVFLALLVVVSQIVFNGWLASAITPTAPLAFALFPLLVWAGLRFGQRGAAITILIAAGTAIWGTARGFGPFALETVQLSLVFLGSYIGVATVTALLLAVAITKHKQMEKALRNQEERYRIISELMSDYAFSYRVEPDGTLVYDWNTRDSFKRITGYAPEEIGGAFTLYHPEDQDRAHHDVKAVVEGRSSSGEYRIITKTGAVRWMHIYRRPVWDSQRNRVIRFYGVAKDITERKEAEVALRQSESLFAKLFQANPAAIVLSVPDTGRYLDVNDSYLRLIGYSRDEVIGRTSLELGIWANPVERNHMVEVIRECGAVRNMGITIRRKSGEIRHGLTSTEFIDLDGKPLLLGMLYDITERKLAEELLRKSEEKYRLVVESSLQAISVIQNNRVVFVNPAMCQIMGYSAAELTSFSAEQILATVHPEDQAIAMGRYRARLQGKSMSSHAQYRVVRPDGTVRWIETSILPMLYEDEPALLSISLDITEYKQVEEALRTSEERYRSLFEESPIPVAEQDFSLVKAHIEILQGQGVTNFRAYFERQPEEVAHCLKLVKIINLNKSFLELYEADSKEELINDLTLLLTQESYKLFIEMLIAIAQGKTRLEQETTNRTLAGELKNIALSWSVLPGYEETFSKVLISIVNMTERKQLEEQLRQAQKMEAIGRLAGGVAHDFNNILTVIKGYAELLLQKLDVHDPYRHDISQIQKSAQRAATLTRQLLAFSRKQVLQPMVLDFNTIVVNMEGMLQRLIGEDIQLTICLEPALGRVKADPGLMEQMIMNLVVNAREAMPNGGQFTIETANVELDEADARRHLDVQPGPYIRLTLTDTGHGMDVETQSRIFEPFFTTKEQGTGLGLATVHGIINQSGGHIRVYSEPGQGTSFEIYLPRVEEETHHWAKSQLQNITASTHGSETILLVEDEPLVREMVCRALLNEGYAVLEASNGEEALQVAQQHQGPLDLLVTDVVMPGGMSGRQLVEHLMPLRREMKVLYISGYTDDAIVHHGVLDAGLAFLQKPFSPRHLADKVREVLDTPQGVQH